MKGRRLYDDGGRIANTILEQLGGAGRLRMMTGAYNFVDLGNGLSFKIKNQRAVEVGIIQNLLEITLQLFCYFFQLEMHSSIFRRKISLFFS